MQPAYALEEGIVYAASTAGCLFDRAQAGLSMMVAHKIQQHPGMLRTRDRGERSHRVSALHRSPGVALHATQRFSPRICPPSASGYPQAGAAGTRGR